MTAPATPTLEQDGQVFVLNLGDAENRLHPEWIAGINQSLDQVEQAEGPRALVTAATGKFFSNGLDLDWLAGNSDQATTYMTNVHALFARVLALPVITVAAIQGHAFAAGAMLTLAHDFRVMREDRGYWCLPEVDIDMVFTAGMNALITARLTPQIAHEAMVTGRRYGGADAAQLQIVDRAKPEAEIFPTALEIARANVSRAGRTLAAIKRRIYANAIAELSPAINSNPSA
jgi:enoyl-CoA hydratase/carnithine racemase